MICENIMKRVYKRVSNNIQICKFGQTYNQIKQLYFTKDSIIQIELTYIFKDINLYETSLSRKQSRCSPPILPLPWKDQII